MCLYVAHGYFRRMSEDAWLVTNRETIDQGRAYLLYCLLGGDAKKVAGLCHSTPEVVESLAHDYNWAHNIQADLSTEAGMDAQRKANRLEQFIVAERARKIITKLLAQFEDDETLIRGSIKLKKGIGDVEYAEFDAKAVESLIKSLGMLGEITYRALGDKEAQDSAASAATAVATGLELYARLQKRFGSPHAALEVTAATVKDVTPGDVSTPPSLRRAG